MRLGLETSRDPIFRVLLLVLAVSVPVLVSVQTVAPTARYGLLKALHLVTSCGKHFRQRQIVGDACQLIINEKQHIPSFSVSNYRVLLTVSVL